KLPRASFGAALAQQWIALGKSLRDDPSLLRSVIERYDHVVQSNRQTGNVKFIAPRQWQSLQAARKIVREKSRRTSLKWRQIIQGRARISAQPLFQISPNPGIVGRSGDPLDRVSGYERISSELLVDHGAVEKHTMLQMAEPPEYVARFRRWRK